MGRSGTGKSVTLKLLMGLLKPDEGQIYVNDVEIEALDSARLVEVRKTMGFLFQYSALFDSLTVAENVAFPLRRHTRMSEAQITECIRERLADVGLEGELDKMPLDLSGGMRKRVGLARALALKPSILLVDEPSSGLDPITTREIDKLLMDLKASSKTTLVVVTHNVPSARRIGDNLVVLHEGHIIVQGTAEQLDQSDVEVVRQFMSSETDGAQQLMSGCECKALRKRLSMASTDKTAMGAFVIGGLVLFGLGLFLIGDRRMLFSKSADYYAEFAQVSGLEAGAKVRVGGMEAGEVVELRVPQRPGSKFRLKFRIIEKLFPVIRADSLASIQTDGLLGNKFLQIDIGTTEPAPPGCTLPSREPFEIGDLLAKIRETVSAIDMTVGEVKGDVTDATQTVAEAAVHVDQIIVAVQAPLNTFTAAASKISEDAGAIIARIRAGEGTLGKLVNDDAVYNSVSGIRYRSSAGARELAPDFGRCRGTRFQIHVRRSSGRFRTNHEERGRIFSADESTGFVLSARDWRRGGYRRGYASHSWQRPRGHGLPSRKSGGAETQLLLPWILQGPRLLRSRKPFASRVSIQGI